jgi:hypothetical protein
MQPVTGGVTDLELLRQPLQALNVAGGASAEHGSKKQDAADEVADGV